MKVRDTSRGRMYAVSSGIGCTAINGAMAVDIPAGGQSVVLALDKKLIISGDDNAKFVEVRWGTNAAVGSRPSPSWMGDILDGLVSIVGVDKFDVNYIPVENKLYLIFSLDTTSAQIEEVKSLCARVLPSNVVTEMEWADGLPMTYTRLDFLEATGSQYIDTGIKLSNESEVRCKFEPLDFAQNQYVYGACTNHLVDDFSCLLQGENTKTCAFRYGTQSLPAGGIKNTITELKHSKEVYIDDKLRFSFKDAVFESMSTCRVFDRNGLRLIGRVYAFSISRNSRSQLNFIPALDHTGRPCMFDAVTREPFYNQVTTGSDFVAGMTWEQVRDLRLPAGGGQLTLSLPYEASIDGLAQAALEQARANGWELTLQYAEVELPAGYSKLDFLEGTGTQYIDTGLKLSNESEVKCSYYIDEKVQGNGYLFGASAPSATSDGIHFKFLASSEARPKNVYAFMGYSNGSALPRPDGLALVTLNSTIFKCNENSLSFKDIPSFETNGSCLIYRTRSAIGGVEAWGAIDNARIYAFNISRSNQLQLAYIPCLDPEGVPCMVDTVTQQPFRNQGTGQFIAGMTLEQVRSLSLPAGGGQLTLSLPYEASIDKLAQTALEQARSNGWQLTLQYAESDVPAGYRKLDFLESTGTQSIDTGVKMSNESGVQCEYMLTSAKGQNEYIFGAKDASANFSFLCNSQVYPDDAVLYINDSSNYAGVRFFGANLNTGVKHSLTCDINAATLDDTTITNPNSTHVFETTNTLRLFNALGFAAKARVYSFSISHAGEMQVDYVPCITPEGKLGMYNKVDGSFQENKGSGAFIAGLATVDDVRNLWLPETNGTITVSVPADTPDSAVDQLRANNPTWQIAIQFRTDNEN